MNNMEATRYDGAGEHSMKAIWIALGVVTLATVVVLCCLR